ncbi:MAG: MBOAT family protein [Polyangiaceae bacterium]|nr:MBOAT family protein [Polyangiaceae bacterium]
MSLSEVEFAYFFPAFFLLYWVLPRRAAVQNWALCAGSLFFYATWNLKLVPLFVASTLVDFAILRGFEKFAAPQDGSPLPTDERNQKRRRALLTLGIVHNLTALAAFKYAGFFADSFNQAFGTSLPVLRLALPVGLSFYTMGRIGVLIDTYYERLTPVRSLGVWFSFVSFFPQLIAGPIGRGSELFEQYENPRKLTADAFLKAAFELATGFVLKVYIAAQVGTELVDPVFAAPGTFTRKAHLLAVVGYAGQVFADFAGYSLIAIGVGRLLGITLPDNFQFPFLSKSLPEVWRRWHMTLNRWLFDYIYGPMVTGDSFMRGRIGAGFLVVMVASGLWHGAAFTYLLWGLLHGLGLLAHHRYDLAYKGLCRKNRVWVERRRSTFYQVAGWMVTTVFFILTLIPFRAPTLAAAGKFARGLWAGGNLPNPPGTFHPYLALLLVVIYHVGALPVFEGFRKRASATPLAMKGLALGAVIVFLMLFAPVGAGTFIYAQF